MIDSLRCYDYNDLSSREIGNSYVRGYNDGLKLMVEAFCLSPHRIKDVADNNG
jgi:hypothetical protein